MLQKFKEKSSLLWKDGPLQPVGHGWAIRVIQPACVLVPVLFPRSLLTWQSVDQDLYKHFIVTLLDQLEITVQWNSGVAHRVIVFREAKTYQDAVGLHKCFIVSNSSLSWVGRERNQNYIFLARWMHFLPCFRETP